MNKTKTIALVSLMAALSIILSIEPFAIPIIVGPFNSNIHFSQIPIFISGVLAGPWAGLLTGAIGGLYMSAIRIPFIIGGFALLGLAIGFFVKKLKIRLMFAGILAWCIQAPYVLVTDYIWLVYFTEMPSTVVLTTISTILLKLTVESLIATIFVVILIPYIKRLELFT